jgi:hypothetical protein
MDEEPGFVRAEEPGWARASGTSIRQAKAIATIVLPALYIFKAPGLIWFPKYTGEECGEQTNAPDRKQSTIFRGQKPLMVFSSSSCDILMFLLQFWACVFQRQDKLLSSNQDPRRLHLPRHRHNRNLHRTKS